MQLLTSAPIVDQIHASTRKQVAELGVQGTEAHLGVIMVGERSDSLKYVAMKQKRAKEVGINLSLYHLDEQTSYGVIEESLQFLNSDTDVHGVIIQLPLPKIFTKSHTDSLVQHIKVRKDVDCLTGAWEAKAAQSNTGLIDLLGQKEIIPPMVASILSLLDHYGIGLIDKSIVIVGRGRLVGQPLTTFFKAKNYNVQTVDENTTDIISITKSADILISATGQDDLITYQWVKEGAVVIDCARDIHLDSVSQIASFVTPAVGGVGPLTVAWLLHNVVTVVTLNSII